jgi:uncharacterized Rmd1/YagE family protein
MTPSPESISQEKGEERAPMLGRGERIVVRAFDVASLYDLRAARERLSGELHGRIAMTNPLLVQIRPRKLLVVFEYGTVVFFNFEPLECERVIAQLKTCSHRPNKEIGKDDFTLLLAPKGKRPEGTDELTVKEFNRDTCLVVAIVLSRSVALEYYEKLVGESLAALEQTMAALAHEGKIRRTEKDLARQVGEALLIEHELVYYIEVFDDPDIIWDGGVRNEQLYRELKREFDLDDRTKAIQQKVSLISRWSTFVISRLEAHRSRMLEWIIIVLIFSEIVLVLFRVM